MTIRCPKFASVQLPDAASLERTDAVTKKIDAILAKTEGVQFYNVVNGFNLLNRVTATYNAFYFILSILALVVSGHKSLRAYVGCNSISECSFKVSLHIFFELLRNPDRCPGRRA